MQLIVRLSWLLESCVARRGVKLTRRDRVEHDTLRHPTSQRHAHQIKELFVRVQLLVGDLVLSETEGCVCPRHDGNLRAVVERSVRSISIAIVNP